MEYVDLNDPVMREQVGIDWATDSLDHGDHLNNSGAEKVTAFVEQYMEEEQLPDHRQEEAYESWNREAEEFLSKA